MKTYKTRDFPVDQIRRFLEPGPIVLVSSTYKGERDVMTMGWHTVLEFSPSLIGCLISSSNHSFDLVRKSKECVIHIPTADMLDTIIGIGNTSGAEINKFEKFKLDTRKGTKVKAPVIRNCYAAFECKLADARLVGKYNFFIFKVVKAHAAVHPKYPQTVHYRGNGVFMISGKNIECSAKFRPENL